MKGIENRSKMSPQINAKVLSQTCLAYMLVAEMTTVSSDVAFVRVKINSFLISCNNIKSSLKTLNNHFDFY